jgi:hypothetical protein
MKCNIPKPVLIFLPISKIGVPTVFFLNVPTNADVSG